MHHLSQAIQFILDNLDGHSMGNNDVKQMKAELTELLSPWFEFISGDVDLFAVFFAGGFPGDGPDGTAAFMPTDYWKLRVLKNCPFDDDAELDEAARRKASLNEIWHFLQVSL